MRRQGNFADSPASAYGAGQIPNAHSDFQGQLEAFTPERDQPYSDSQVQPEGQWRWERDGPNMPRPMSATTYNEGKSLLTVKDQTIVRKRSHHMMGLLLKSHKQ